MRYSYEFKLKCVELYRKGELADVPEGLSRGNFRRMVRKWVRIEDAQGPGALRHKNHNRLWSAEEKYELVSQVLAGHSNKSVAINAGINEGQLYQWVRNYKNYGYNGLVNKKKGPKSKNTDMKKINYDNPRKLKESEYEELIRLREENKCIKSEIEVIKKEIALREEKEAAQLKAKKQQSSKNSAKKGIN